MSFHINKYKAHLNPLLFLFYILSVLLLNGFLIVLLTNNWISPWYHTTCRNSEFITVFWKLIICVQLISEFQRGWWVLWFVYVVWKGHFSKRGTVKMDTPRRDGVIFIHLLGDLMACLSHTHKVQDLLDVWLHYTVVTSRIIC